MRRLGFHSFAWTDGRMQAGLEGAMEKAAACGFRIIELTYLRPEEFRLQPLAKRAKALDLDIVVTMGLPLSADLSSEDAAVVRAGEAMLSDAVNAVRDVGGIRLAGILYSAHTKYARMPAGRGRRKSVAAVAKTADLVKQAGVELVLETVTRFETNLLNATAQGLDFIRQMGSDHVRLHLDTFRMNIEEVDPAAAVRLAGDKIGYFHVGESNRGYLGAGVIDFDRIFDALVEIGYARDVAFESFPAPLSARRCRWRAASGATSGPTMRRLLSTRSGSSNGVMRRRSAAVRPLAGHRPEPRRSAPESLWRALHGN